MWHDLLVAVVVVVVAWVVPVAAKTGGVGSVNPAAIMMDMRSAPRFQVKMLRDLISDSELSSVVAELSTSSSAIDASSDSSIVIYDPLVLRVGRTWQLLCQVPRVNERLLEEEEEDDHGEDEDEESEEVVVERGLALLEPLRERCLTYAGGWWTFEYCHGQHVRQFHVLAPGKEIEFRLGAYAQRQALENGATTLVRRVGRSRYLAQVWGGGTVCDMTREPRSVEIQFHCDPHGPERIAMVEEVEVCSYAMVINSPRLCADPLFYDTSASRVYDITCQQVLPDADYAKAVASQKAIDEAEADEDDDDLPLAEVTTKKNKEKKDSAQIVVSLNDPGLPQLSKGSQEMLRKLMAIAYDAPRLLGAMPQVDDEDERKGGSSGGGGGRPGGGGGGKPSGGSSKPAISGGGGSGGKGSGSLGDRPPSYASLYPDRSGVNAGGKGTGSGDSSRPYGPPPAYSANAQYTSVNRGQTVQPHTFASNAPTVYYASPARATYPGAWGYGFYPIFPYPWWAYGGGVWVGSSYHGSSYNHGVNSYKPEFRNITVVNATNIPFIGDIDLFDNKSNVTLTDFNNGTLRVAPCGNSTSDKLQVSSKDCDFIVLDLRNGTVVAGNARASVLNEVTFFNLTLGNRTTVLRTQTISSTEKKMRGGVVAGIVLGCIGFVVLVCVVFWWCSRLQAKKRFTARK
ncbi:Protein OS-9 [Coemansia sp. BCRC 34301]|nr:Protein OS-9 [Coemansia sp. BCRC 34301]